MVFEDSIKMLAEAARELNAASDSVNEIIESREDAIRQTGIGIAAWLGDVIDESSSKKIEDSRGEETEQEETEGWQLGFCKLGADWRLAVKRVRLVRTSGDESVEFFDIGQPIPLLDAPRIVRLEALEEIERLMHHLAFKATHYVKTIAQKKSAAK